MTDRSRKALAMSVLSAHDAGVREVTGFHLASALIAAGGLASNLAVNLGFDLSALPKVNYADNRPAAGLVPFNQECRMAGRRASLMLDAWNSRRLFDRLGPIGTDAVLLGLLGENPKVGECLHTTFGECFCEMCRLLGWQESVALVRITPDDLKTGFEGK